MGLRVAVDVGSYGKVSQPLACRGCVRVEVDMMAENRVHTYSLGPTSGAPSSPSGPELVRRYRHPRSGSLVHPHMGRARVRGVVVS